MGPAPPRPWHMPEGGGGPKHPRERSSPPLQESQTWTRGGTGASRAQHVPPLESPAPGRTAPVLVPRARRARWAQWARRVQRAQRVQRARRLQLTPCRLHGNGISPPSPPFSPRPPAPSDPM
uniref:Uncharacterized protein n=1 Tax=Myotis myotis TaxID=51298 RepID=A0A7J7V3H0_MYOMY|nr:hypothetical protein mMyoMyo1_008418 [Myotis myotis]